MRRLKREKASSSSLTPLNGGKYSWDNNPRYQTFRPGVVKNNTPEQFGKALERAQDYADSHPGQPPLITVNSWNGWTETSYLQPDDLYGYLEAVKQVFKNG